MIQKTILILSLVTASFWAQADGNTTQQDNVIVCKTTGQSLGQPTDVTVTFTIEGSLGLQAVPMNIVAVGNAFNAYYGMAHLTQLTEEGAVLHFETQGAEEELRTIMSINLETLEAESNELPLSGTGSAAVLQSIDSILRPFYDLSECTGVLK